MKYRKKPVCIEAIQYLGHNFNLVRQFVGNGFPLHQLGDGVLGIQTLEGVMSAQIGDWIIRGVKGEHYPCKPDIFEATYEPVAAENCGEPVRVAQQTNGGAIAKW